MKKKILIFIGARGGSKGVKGKNIRPLCGRPLIVYTIKQALQWRKADRVIVSTDSPKIARIAKRAGAQVPFLRPAPLASDTAPKGLAIHHALVECERIFNEQYDIVVNLDATAPVRTTKDLDNCLKIFLRDRPKTLFSVVSPSRNPYFNMVEKKGKGKVVICKTLKNTINRRQDAPAVYAMNASIYFYRRDYILRSPKAHPISDDTRIYVMDDFAGIDIDREIDFQFIEFLLKKGLVKL